MAGFDRSELITQLMSQITTQGLLAGDHVAPVEGGWSTGQPGQGEYVAYTVLSAGAVNFRPSVMVPGKNDATAAFDIKCYGATREQADDISNRVEAALTGFKPQFGGYRANMVWRRAIGAMNRIDSTNPKTWMVADSWAVECVPSP